MSPVLMRWPMVVSRAVIDNAPSTLSPVPAPPARAPRLWRDLVVLTGGQLASKVLGFLAFALLARTLEASGYGAVEYAAGLAFLAGMIVDAGLSPIGVRQIARDAGSTAGISADILGARLALAAATAVVLAALSPWLSPDPAHVGLIAVYALSLVAVPWAQMWLFQAVDRIGWTAAVQCARMLVFAVLVVALVRRPGDFLRVGVAEIAGLAVSGVLAIELQRRHVAPVGIALRPRRMVRLLGEGLPVALSNFALVLAIFAPLLLAVNLLGAGGAAHFAAAHRLYFALATLSWLYHFNLFPVLARGESGAVPELPALVTSSVRLVAWFGAGAALVLTLLAAPLLAVAFGAPFASAATAFGVLVWTLPVKMLADHAGWLLIAHGGERVVLTVRLAAVAATFALGVPGIRRWGPVGGAVALLVACLLTWAGLHWSARRRLGWMPWTPALGPAVATVALLLGARELDRGAVATTALVTAGWLLLAAPFARTLLDDVRRLASAKGRAPQEAAP